ncbi:MAG: ABC transporter permease [Planctomycetaceae bacterium]|jgi:hypothetical protein|nr:ABC transporter permease [Planctomycetaceae bacterium]
MRSPLFSVNINPLLLRELRQQVRNRFIITLINLYVAVLVLVCLANLLFQQNSLQIHGVGGILFSGLAVTMGIACFFAVVVYTAFTTASERINNDLMFTSALKPSTIVFGKVFAGAILTVLLMSITAPFVMVAYLLRGLDIEMVARTFLGLFVMIQVCNGIAICLSSNIRTKTQMVGIICGGFFVFMTLLNFIISFIYFPFGSGVNPWIQLFWLFLLIGSIYSIFLAAAIASIAPSTSNRLLPIRLTVTVIYFGSLLISFVFSSPMVAGMPLGMTTDTVVIWVYVWMGILAVLMLMPVCERETWSRRIKRTLPKNRFFRAVLFPFYTGSANSLVWLALLGFGIFVVVITQTEEFFNTAAFDWLLFSFNWLLFSFDYCVTAMFLRMYFFPKKTTPEQTLGIVLCLFLFCVPGGMFACFLLHNSASSTFDFYSAYRQSIFSVLNPFLLNEETREPHFFALFWGLGLLVLLLNWFRLRVWHFSPYDVDETMTLEQAIAAIREAEANPLVQSDQERLQKEQTNSNAVIPIS